MDDWKTHPWILARLERAPKEISREIHFFFSDQTERQLDSMSADEFRDFFFGNPLDIVKGLEFLFKNMEQFPEHLTPELVRYIEVLRVWALSSRSKDQRKFGAHEQAVDFESSLCSRVRSQGEFSLSPLTCQNHPRLFDLSEDRSVRSFVSLWQSLSSLLRILITARSFTGSPPSIGVSWSRRRSGTSSSRSSWTTRSSFPPSWRIDCQFFSVSCSDYVLTSSNCSPDQLLLALDELAERYDPAFAN